MKCIDCNYYWVDEGEKYPRCHCTESAGNAPCELDEDEETEDINEEGEDENEDDWDDADDDCGFDPYLGCYTDDC